MVWDGRIGLCSARWQSSAWRAYKAADAHGEALRYATYQSLISAAFQACSACLMRPNTKIFYMLFSAPQVREEGLSYAEPGPSWHAATEGWVSLASSEFGGDT